MGRFMAPDLVGAEFIRINEKFFHILDSIVDIRVIVKVQPWQKINEVTNIFDKAFLNFASLSESRRYICSTASRIRRHISFVESAIFL